MIQEQDTNIELSSNIDSDKQLLLQETLSTKRKICMGVAFSVGKFHYVMFQNANLFFNFMIFVQLVTSVTIQGTKLS